MAYSTAVVDHYQNPRNVGSMDMNLRDVGTGIVGAPECGDVMRLQIKVDENDRIIDAKFKTFGCLASNVPIATPDGYIRVLDLNPGDSVWAWNGAEVVENTIQNMVEHEYHMSELIRMQFEGSVHFSFITTKNHIWWKTDNTPTEAIDMKCGDQLFSLTENELRSRNNIGRSDWMKSLCSYQMKTTNQTLDHSALPQNQKGFKHSEEFCQKISLASKKKWQSVEYQNNWKSGMNGAYGKRPTQLEQKFITLFTSANCDVRYVGNGSFWAGSSHLNPDFKVNGQRKVIEVYTKKMPDFMQDRSTDEWIVRRSKKFADAGFASLFISIEEIESAIDRTQKFIHNGLTLIGCKEILNQRQLRGLKRNKEFVSMYDIQLKEGANVFFAGRLGTHNCGSAIASSSLVTEWIKGKSIDEALQIKNTDIVHELALPPVKIHCSVLAEDAVRAAIKDYQDKKGNLNAA